MAQLYPFSQQTAERLAEMPGAGGTHRWLAEIAGGLQHILTAEQCTEFLRGCCDQFVEHREVPDREIAAAIELAYGEHTENTADSRKRKFEWPAAHEAGIKSLLEQAEPVFDGVTTTGLHPNEVLEQLFREEELICTGMNVKSAVVRPLANVLSDAEQLQLICVNPMRDLLAFNYAGKHSARCQNNVRVRRYLVAEFDDPGLGKREQAQIATMLGDLAPLVMAVDSGGKSIHAWYLVEGMTLKKQVRFFATACLFGADPTRWDICGWLRMPGGLRYRPDGKRIRQKILYWRPDLLREKSPEKTKSGSTNEQFESA